MATDDASPRKPDRWPLVPFLVIIGGLILAGLLSTGYTHWAIGAHSRQACSELQIIATAPGAGTPFDRTIEREYRALYELRCG